MGNSKSSTHAPNLPVNLFTLHLEKHLGGIDGLKCELISPLKLHHPGLLNMIEDIWAKLSGKRVHPALTRTEEWARGIFVVVEVLLHGETSRMVFMDLSQILHGCQHSAAITERSTWQLYMLETNGDLPDSGAKLQGALYEHGIHWPRVVATEEIAGSIYVINENGTMGLRSFSKASLGNIPEPEAAFPFTGIYDFVEMLSKAYTHMRDGD